MQTRNITLSLPEETLREVKVLAARRGTSVSALLSETLTDILASEHGYAAAREEPGGARSGTRPRHERGDRLGQGRVA